MICKFVCHRLCSRFRGLSARRPWMLSLDPPAVTVRSEHRVRTQQLIPIPLPRTDTMSLHAIYSSFTIECSSEALLSIGSGLLITLRIPNVSKGTSIVAPAMSYSKRSQADHAGRRSSRGERQTLTTAAPSSEIGVVLIRPTGARDPVLGRSRRWCQGAGGECGPAPLNGVAQRCVSAVVLLLTVGYRM